MQVKSFSGEVARHYLHEGEEAMSHRRVGHSCASSERLRTDRGQWGHVEGGGLVTHCREGTAEKNGEA